MFKHIAASILIGSSLAACVAEPGTTEDIESAEQALDPKCVNATPVKTFTGSADYTPAQQAYTMPDCYKAHVIDINNLSSAYVGSGGIQHGGIYVTWADVGPSDETACVKSSVRAILFEKNGSAWTQLDDVTVNGEYFAAGGGWSAYCNPPALSFTSELRAGKSYRIAFTGRTPSGQTRKVRVKTESPVR